MPQPIARAGSGSRQGAGRVALCVLVLLCSGGHAAAPESRAQAHAALTEVESMVENIHWLGHDSFRIEGAGRVVYIDPYRLQREAPKADLILVTHDHFDHCSPEDVARVRSPESVVVTIAAAAAGLPDPVRIVRPGDTLTVAGIRVEAVAAYNVNKFRSPGQPFHPREAGHVGFVVTVDGRRIYHAGDTDFIPEMAAVSADVALLPGSGTYVMTVQEAIQAAAAISPRVAVPMHVGAGIGALEDAARFKAQATVPVVVLDIER